MKIAVSAGHNVYIGMNFDPGAISYPYVEANINRETVALLIPLLKAQGHTVIDVTPYEEQFFHSKDHHVVRCKRVDEFNADLFLDIHINAGGGEGVEVWVHNMSGKSVPYATKISENISKDIGLKNRGVKVKPSYWSVSLTSKPAMIIEGAFIDNKSDMEKLTPLKYATAIAKCFGEVKEEKQKDIIKINLHGKDLEVEGILKDQIYHVPIKFLERLGYEVGWDQVNKTIVINYKGEDK